MWFENLNERTNGILVLTDDLVQEESNCSIKDGLVKILWNRNSAPVNLSIDGKKIALEENHIVTVTFFHQIEFEAASLPLTAFLFNREFYCLVDHDSEIACNGILFFGAQETPLLSVDRNCRDRFLTLYEFFIDEFRTKDRIQGEMLLMLLKRLILLCTNLAKEQLKLECFDEQTIDIIRKFNFLVDAHYKEIKRVGEYARLLHRSPKTLANLFLLYNRKNPQQTIHERITLEAKRLLRYTSKSSKEIGHILGFEEPAHFGKFFKKNVGMTPGAFRKIHGQLL